MNFARIHFILICIIFLISITSVLLTSISILNIDFAKGYLKNPKIKQGLCDVINLKILKGTYVKNCVGINYKLFGENQSALVKDFWPLDPFRKSFGGYIPNKFNHPTSTCASYSAEINNYAPSIALTFFNSILVDAFTKPINFWNKNSSSIFTIFLSDLGFNSTSFKDSNINAINTSTRTGGKNIRYAKMFPYIVDLCFQKSGSQYTTTFNTTKQCADYINSFNDVLNRYPNPILFKNSTTFLNTTNYLDLLYNLTLTKNTNNSELLYSNKFFRTLFLTMISCHIFSFLSLTTCRSNFLFQTNLANTTITSTTAFIQYVSRTKGISLSALDYVNLGRFFYTTPNDSWYIQYPDVTYLLSQIPTVCFARSIQSFDSCTKDISKKVLARKLIYFSNPQISNFFIETDNQRINSLRTSCEYSIARYESFMRIRLMSILSYSFTVVCFFLIIGMFYFSHRYKIRWYYLLPGFAGFISIIFFTIVTHEIRNKPYFISEKYGVRNNFLIIDLKPTSMYIYNMFFSIVFLIIIIFIGAGTMFYGLDGKESTTQLNLIAIPYENSISDKFPK